MWSYFNVWNRKPSSANTLISNNNHHWSSWFPAYIRAKYPEHIWTLILVLNIFITQSKYTPSKFFAEKTKLSEIKGLSTNFSLVSQRNFRYVQNQIFSESFFITNHKLPLQSIIMLSANKYEKTASNVTMWHISHTYTNRSQHISRKG